MLKFGSLFAGIGGFDLGLERAGMIPTWQVEIDAKCQKVLARHWPDVERYEDVREVGKRNLQPVDLVCGGFPCQDVSIAGNRAGLAGERSGLWFEFHRILAELEPGWVIVENVPGLLSSNGGRDFAVILRGLVQLGYGVCWRVLDAQFFGVAQRRRRVFVVGHLGDGCAAGVLFESSGSAWDSAPSREEGQRVAAPVKAGAPGRRNGGSRPIADEFVVSDPITASPYADNEAQHSKLIAFQSWASTHNSMNPSEVAPPLDVGKAAGTCIAFDRTRGTFSGDITGPLRVNGGRSPGVNDGKADNQCVVFQSRYYTRAGKSGGKPSDIVNLTAQTGDSAPCVAYGVSENQRAEFRLTPYSRQITGGGGKPGQGYPAALTQYGVRRLTPTECERLQDFPDGHTAGQSDTARYKQSGNAVCVSVVEWIGKRIVRHHPV